MVDEAAAIPAALLGQWLTAFPRIAFATTVHGYEGSGRGFALRFRATLDRLTPQWKALTLNAPIRWRSGDPGSPGQSTAVVKSAAAQRSDGWQRRGNQGD
ncbi:hypothetical protein HORIV_56560 [Vreelandella olivaria]|uniref:TcmA/NAT10 helicase domain-containing protein n=1 Tax=Vreelandella olivaria TaxID=390919 RepID=A0ABM7GQC9_9GAMM|nr:hypothetical protein HORIV_56560 [Halomonas olivaria]